MKKNAIRSLIVAFAFAALSLPALAQGGEGQGPHRGMPSVDERLQHLTQKLNLTTDQQAKVKSILEDQQSQTTALRQDTSLSQQDRRAKFQQIHEASTQKIRETLTDDQKAKFDEMQSHKGNMGKHGGQNDAGSTEKQ